MSNDLPNAISNLIEGTKVLDVCIKNTAEQE